MNEGEPAWISDAHLHYGLVPTVRAAAEHSPLRERFPCYRTVAWDQMGDYEQVLSQHHCAKTVLIPFVFRELDRREENRLVLAKAAEAPQRFFPYLLLDETDLAFAAAHTRQIVGLKQHIVLHETRLSPARREVLAWMQEHGLILLFHSHWQNRIDYVREIKKNFPHLKIQIAHMGRSTPTDAAFMLSVIEAMRPYEDVCFDTSTVRLAEVLTVAVTRIGAERILYGSDFPFFMDGTGREDMMEEQVRCVLSAGLTDREREQIFTGNFQRFVVPGR